MKVSPLRQRDPLTELYIQDKIEDVNSTAYEDEFLTREILDKINIAAHKISIAMNDKELVQGYDLTEFMKEKQVISASMQTRKCMQKHIDNLYQILNLVEQMKKTKDDG